MLRISPSEATAAQVKKYFIKHSSPEAYYSEGQDFNGIWIGKGAARLGLSGSLQDGAFSRLCDNLHPLTGKKLTLRMKEGRRVGYDVNFHVPKSVSLAYFYSGDERIIQRIRQAAYETVLDMQEQAATRVRKKGRDEDRLTKELVCAEFLHKTARPVGGFPDPLIHVHVYVFNATYDPEEGVWKALEFGRVMKEAPGYQAAFHARLSTYLKELGLHIEANAYAFEIAGVERLLIKKFSRRTEVIQAEAAKRGITDAAEMAKLGALTRERKVQDVPISELTPLWWARLTPDERQVLEAIKADLKKTRERETRLERSADALGSRKELGASRGSGSDGNGRPVSQNRATWPVERKQGLVVPTAVERAAVDFAVEHLFERRSVVTENQLIAEAFKNWNYGQATLEGVRAAVWAWPFIRVERDGRTLFTSEEVLAEERRIVKACQEGRERFAPLHPGWRIRDNRLNPQQREAVSHVLNSRDFITGISGKAGTGKTTLLHEARKGIEAGGQRLCVFAPTAEAARETLRKQGFAEAETVARLLSSARLQAECAGAVWWVDEAGLLSARTMDRLVALAKSVDSRLVLVGDIGQHHAVERGQAFDLLQKFGGMAVAEVDEIQRQQGDYKLAVDLISERRFEEGLAVLEKMGAIHEIALKAEREQAAAKGYADALEARESVLVTSPTHNEGRSVTEAIRQELKERGKLGAGRKWSVLRDLGWTKARKRDARGYEPGLMVEINLPIEGFAIGERLEVVDGGKDFVLAKGLDGRTKELPLSHPEHFSVCMQDEIEVCVGDKIRITANGQSADGHDLNRGNFFTVKKFKSNGEMVLNNGCRLEKDFAHLDHGYVPTSHVAQSKTVDWIFVVQSAEQSAAATDANQFYVSVSRGRKGVKIYTDSLELLRENASRLREREMAMELIQREEEQVANRERLAESQSQGVAAVVESAEIKWAFETPAAAKPQAVERPAEWLGTQKELEREAAEAAERMMRAKEQEQALALEM